MKKKSFRSRSRVAVLMAAVLTLTMIPLEGSAFERLDGAGPGAAVISEGTVDNLPVMEQRQNVPASSLTAEGYLESSQTGGTIVSSSDSGSVITGSIRLDPGYDLATVRYEHTDGSCEYAELTGSGGDYSFTVEKNGSGKLVPEYFSTEVWDGAVDFSWYDSSRTEFYLSTPAQLAGLAALVNGMTDRSLPDYRIRGDRKLLITHRIDNFQLTGAGGGNQYATVYQADAAADFAGKTVYLTKDMDMGGVFDADSGSWSGPNWTPVGGKYPMEPSTGEYLIESFFNGILDGQGHDIRNLYCDRFTEKGYAYSQAIGFVGYLGDLYGDETLPEGWIPAVRNLTVAGDIYGRRMVAGIVGRVGRLSQGVVIENCANYARIRNTDSKGVGGICGAGWGKGIIRSCYNRGDVTTVYSCPTGGICGSNGGMDLYNCYNTGRIDSNGQKRGRGIGSHDSGSYVVDNCYFLEGCSDDPGEPGYYCGTALNITVNVTEMTEARMKSAEMLDALNQNGKVFVRDQKNNNSGFPILYFQAEEFDSQTDCTITLEQSAGGSIGVSGGLTVPRGTVVKLTASPDGGYLFRNYSADGHSFSGAFYTVLDDVTISAEFSKMKKGALEIRSSDECTVSILKTGTVLNEEGQAESVSKIQLEDGGALYEGDSLTAEAHLRQGAAPADPSKEYTGAFRYTFTYSDGNSSVTERGGHEVEKAIQDRTLTVTAEALTRNKNWSALADTSWYTGQSSDYAIQSPAQLAGLAKLVNSGESFEGITVCLAQDISLANTDGTGAVRQWSAVGSGTSNAFKGIFDGKGCTVSDMTAVSGGSYAGLFGYCEGAVIRNVTVRGTSTAQGSAAGIAGHLSGGVITDCTNRVKVTSTGQYAAGIAAGISDGAEVRKSVNYGKISGTSSVAGIVGGSGQLADRIVSCVNYARITGNASLSGGTGGIAGSTGGRVERCANYGDISSNGWYTGGLVGHTSSADTVTMETSQIRNSYNQGDVYSENRTRNAAAGGLIGYAQYVNMDNCYNTGKVELTDDNTSSSCEGSLAGRFYRSVYNHIENSSVLDSSCATVMDVNYTALDYVHVAVMTADDMGKKDFCVSMNDRAGDTIFTMARYPEFLKLKENRLCTVEYTGDYTGSRQVYAGDPAVLPEPPEGSSYTFTVNGVPWTGEIVTGDVTVAVTRSPAEHTVSFYADDRMISVEKYHEGDTAVSEPPIPEKAGYTASWPDYTLDGSDIRVNAVYAGSPVYGGSRLSANEYYCLAADATGVITVEAGGKVTLDGSEGAAQVQIVLEKGASLVLKNVETSYNGSVLVLKGDNTVEIQGVCRVIGASSESENPDPSILAEGRAAFTGSGVLYSEAQNGNAVMQVAAGAEATIDGPKLELFKFHKLGIDGGVLNGPGSVRLNSGLLASFSDSDNLYAASLGSFTQNGGTAIFMCDDNEQSIRADSITLNGGSFRVQGRSHEDPSIYYENADAVACRGFSETYQLTQTNVSALGAPYSVTVGSTVSMADGAYKAELLENREGFEVSAGDTLYVWSRGGSRVSVKGSSGAAYTAAVFGNRVNALFSEAPPEGSVIAAAAYNPDGILLDYASADASPESSMDLNVEEASVVRIFVYRSREDMAPLMPETSLLL